MKPVVVLLMAVVALTAGVSRAAADEPGATYTVRGCPSAPGAADPRGGWFSSTFPAGVPLDWTYRPCAGDGVFGIDMSDQPFSSTAGMIWSFLTPDPLKIARVRLERRVRAGNGFYYMLSTALGGKLEETIGSAPRPPKDWTPLAIDMKGGQFLTLMLSCASAPSCPSTADQSFSVRGFEADVTDPTAPTLQYGLTTDQPPPARPSTFTLTVEAADTGSGVKTLTATIDGTAIGTSTGDGTCATSPYPVPGPCPLSARMTVPVARDVLERGTGQLVVEAADAAGNITRTEPIPLWKFGYAAPAPAPAPAPPPAAAPHGVLTLGFKGTTKTHIESRYSAPPTITGVVRDTAGTPLSGVTVRIDTKLLTRDARSSPLKTLTTDKSGAFSLRLPRGPSREIQATALTGDAVSVAVLRTRVAAPLRLTTNHRSTRNHRTITFTGSVPGVGKTARTRIDLQALGGGGRWLTFTTATLKNGRFRGKYTFTRTFTPTTYRFRALLRSDPTFPYAAGTSREIRVRVRP
jgi:hypothetical protein